MRLPSGDVLFGEIRLLAIRAKINVSGVEGFQNTICRCLRKIFLLKNFSQLPETPGGQQELSLPASSQFVDPVIREFKRSAVWLPFTLHD